MPTRDIVISSRDGDEFTQITIKTYPAELVLEENGSAFVAGLPRGIHFNGFQCGECGEIIKPPEFRHHGVHHYMHDASGDHEPELPFGHPGRDFDDSLPDPADSPSVYYRGSAYC